MIEGKNERSIGINKINQRCEEQKNKRRRIQMKMIITNLHDIDIHRRD